ncbi:DUF4097 domain-containing protein [Bacillus sp. DNRA2]|uniref:DUF4097 family beta strand repeat-containing protein n=1 Tax=Bacillus sp. DNRA2 TaxID=2723053 RepID=UPI00145C4572|nr:DUF4097 family beta strand repeat-containing protein [Bacillus sp. DNRA2]NMD71474.1 DUF4097 domain-containing protein [Bacillus sp. DNRA2]
MINMKNISVVALVLLLIGIVGSLLTYKPVMKERLISEEKVVNQKFNKIEIKSDAVGVELLPTTDSKAKVKLSGNAGNAENHLATKVKNDALTIEVDYKQTSFINFLPTSLSLKVYVPENIYESLKIENKDGGIKVGRLQANEIDIRTINGGIELSHTNGTNVVTETMDGSIKLNKVGASFIRTNTVNGSIVLEGVLGQLSGKNKDGSIKLVTNDLDRSIDFETVNGNIHIQSGTEPTNATINASSVDGNVSIFDSTKTNEVFGKGQNIINLSTMDGGITVEKK